MSFALCVENLSKRYRLQRAQTRFAYRTLRETLSGAVAWPFRWGGKGSEDFWALRDVSFEISAGQVVGIIGRNGSGKSTLLKILCRVTSPTSGQATLRGRVGSLLEVGTGFHPELTGRQNIYLNGSILGMSRRQIDARFEQIVDFAQTERFLDMPVKRYSSGMYVRLAFAVAAHMDPEILLVDEVLAVGDAAFQEKCLGKLRDISRQGRTVLFVSHNLHAVAKLTQQAILLDQGKALAQGPTPEVIAQYLSSGAAFAAQWTRPPGDAPGLLRFSALRVCDQSGTPAACFDADRAFDIQLDFVVHAPLRAQIAFRLNSSSDGCTVFTSALSDATGESFNELSPGCHRAVCHVPAHLLRPGLYHLLVAANNPAGPQFDLIEQVLQFQVTPVGSLVNVDQRLGWVVPRLDWECRAAA
jgi:lipopolysaccharide transport system ATP-binding protein